LPWGYLEQGRVIKRSLFPVAVTTTFYDANYNAVTQADKPGRYGAVVKISLTGGVVLHRYITLYRTPAKVFWTDDVAGAKVVARLPSTAGIDPAVLQKQGAEIGRVVTADFFGDDGNSPGVAVILAGLSEMTPGDPPAVARTSIEAHDANWWFGLRQKLGLVKPYPYLVDLPAGYDADPAKKWPVIFYLHSGQQKGRDLGMVRTSGLAGLIAKGKQVPAVVISPQCPPDESWNPRVLALLLDAVSAKYRIDPDRVSLTGISAGGDACFDFATFYPEKVAALAPIAGDGDPADVARLKGIALWDFQGMKDEIVPPDNPLAVVKALRAIGGHPHQTLFPDAGHYDSWGLAYGTDALVPWLLAQKRGQAEAAVPGGPVP
jgi:pimeloyl-ACP methyl ester carboxylesterase